MRVRKERATIAAPEFVRLVCRQTLALLAVLLAVLVGVVPQANADDAVIVTSTTPANGATNVPVDVTITVTFNQSVDVTGAWAEMFCFTSGGHTLAVSGGPQTWQLDPDGALAPDESCAVTIKASNVEGMVSNYTFSFITGSAPAPNVPPTVGAGGPYSVAEGSSVTVSATGTDPEGGLLSYAWDLDNDGTFETAGQSVSFSAASLDGPSTVTINVRATDDGDLTNTATASVTVANVPPTATFDAPASAAIGSSFMLSLSGPEDPSSADTAAGFTYAFACGGGYGSFGSSATAACSAADPGTLSVGGKIKDKDGDVTEYNATVQVLVTFEGVCDLVQSVVSKPGVADGLCAKLAAAEAAADRGELNAEENELQAFRNLVHAQIGKTISVDDAELLEKLSQGL